VDIGDGVERVTRVREAERLVASIVLAFSADPFVRWLLPGSDEFVRYFTRITQLHGVTTAAAGGAWGLPDSRGAAFWYPPGVHPDGEALGAISSEAGIIDRVRSVWGLVEAYEPSGPHWYLRQIGVDPMLQGGGHGGTLIRAGLHQVDRRGEVAYLEATSIRSRTFYERHGFETLGEVQVGDSAPLWPMIRQPNEEPRLESVTKCP
jgi:ribosomal protein S18 acetylase RimI-like enzyme